MLFTFLRLEKEKKLNLSSEWNANWSIIPLSKQNKAMWLVSLKDLLRVIVLCLFSPWVPEIPKSKKKTNKKKPTDLYRQSTGHEMVDNLTKRPASGLKRKPWNINIY